MEEASEKLEKVELILKQVKLCLKGSVPVWTLELLHFIETDEIGELLKSMGVEGEYERIVKQKDDTN